MIQEQIERVLQAVIGFPLTAAGRAADLEWFHFGRLREVPAYGGKTKRVGDYALHAQCAWRIRSATRIIVASQDRYCSADETQVIEGQFNWDVAGANRCDQNIKQWLASFEGRMPTVQQVVADEVGSLCLVLSSDIRLDIFPDSTDIDGESEHWRFFQTGTNQHHFVMRASGLFTE